MPYATILDTIMQYHGFHAGVSPTDLQTSLLGTGPNIIPTSFINELGPAKNVFLRKTGALSLSTNDHIRSLVYALLSNQRPWGPIAANTAVIDSIFSHFDAAILKSVSPESLVHALTNKHLGNRALRKQMDSLKDNILYLESLAAAYGSIDTYYNSMIASGNTAALVKELIKHLRCMGFSLTCEYLKSVGVDVCKPDVHVVRFVSSDRMNWDPSITSAQTEKDKLKTIDLIAKISSITGFPSAAIDAFIWNFCNQETGICGKNPICSKCPIKGHTSTVFCHYKP